ncbi:pericentrin Pcp1, putative [Babesia ovis]|uniref:Pericentrin Pcp1, putative n=1 Tax=Babesia ovis TaxID=5869 RepID=A0A9W5T855_BABOV|nr:pericentrin Pcp1, putative [Babesia ovis]
MGTDTRTDFGEFLDFQLGGDVPTHNVHDAAEVDLGDTEGTSGVPDEAPALDLPSNLNHDSGLPSNPLVKEDIKDGTPITEPVPATDFPAELRAMEEKLAEKDRHCVMLEQQLIQANRQVETCYYEMEENGDRLRRYASEISSLRAEIERKASALENANANVERLGMLEAEKCHLSEMVAELTRELESKSRDANVSMASNATMEQLLADLEGDNVLLKDQLQTMGNENARFRDQIRSMEEEGMRIKGQLRAMEAENSHIKDQVGSLTNENTRIKQQSRGLEDENTRIKEQLQAVESERQAHKQKFTEMYGLYQQLQEENLGLAAELKGRDLSVSAPSESSVASPQYRELTEELDRISQRCREKDVEIAERDGRLHELQHRIKVLELESRKKAGSNTAASSQSHDTGDLRRLEDEIRIMKINNAGLISEISSLKAQITDKNARIDHLNCELMMQQQRASSPSHRRDVDLEAYMHHRRVGYSSAEAQKLSTLQEAIHQVFTDPLYRKCFVVYLAIMHILVVALLLM